MIKKQSLVENLQHLLSFKGKRVKGKRRRHNDALHSVHTANVWFVFTLVCSS